MAATFLSSMRTRNADTAADSLHELGFCMFPPLVDAEIVERCRTAARPLLDAMLQRAERFLRMYHGRDWRTSVALQFQELYARTTYEQRFDFVVPCDEATSPWAALLAAVDPIVRPVLCRSTELFPDGDDSIRVEAVGCVLSLPGAPEQSWHPDSPDEVGLVNVFVPLLDLTESLGPTALGVRSHRHDGGDGSKPHLAAHNIVRPLIRAGGLLIFDWRLWHRGGANTGTSERPVAYITYARRGVEGTSYKRGLPSLFGGHALKQ